MIKANEYREGIIVLDVAPYDKVHKVDLNMIINALGNGYRYRGIPLTPEWLERCVKVNGMPYMLSDRIGLIKNKVRDASGNYDGFVIAVKVGLEMKALAGMKVIRFVHEAQNIYFALTGEELNVKL